MTGKQIIEELEKNYGYSIPKLGISKHQYEWLCDMANDIQEVVKNNDSLHSVISCPKCENPYPHLHKDGSKSCDECGHTWG